MGAGRPRVLFPAGSSGSEKIPFRAVCFRYFGDLFKTTT
jgi:hypothetical protein